MFTATDSLVEVAVPNTDIKRFFAFYYRYSAVDPPETKQIPDLFGVVQYGPAEGPAQRVLLRVTGDSSTYDYESTQALVHDTVSKWRRAELWSSDGNRTAPSLSRFGVLVTLRARDREGNDLPNAEIRIPVSDDKLDLAHASLPKSFRLQRVY